MKTTRLFFLLFICLFLFSCCPARVPFTLEETVLFEGELDKLQYYIDQEVRLRRALKYEEKIIEDRHHRVRVVRNRKVLEITIPQYTPGILGRVDGDTIFIRFENIPDEKERVIPFVLAEDEKNGPGYRYELRAKTLVYGGETFDVVLADRDVPVSKQDVSVYAGKTAETSGHHILKPEYPVLLIELLEKEYYEDRSRKVPGLKVNR